MRLSPAERWFAFLQAAGASVAPTGSRTRYSAPTPKRLAGSSSCSSRQSAVGRIIPPITRWRGYSKRCAMPTRSTASSRSWGFADGARSAATYARMSRKFFEGLTTVSSRAWAQWDDPGRSFRDGMPVHLISGGEDAPALAQARAVEKDVEAEQGNCRLTILPDENRRVPSLRGAAFFAALAQTAAMPIER